MISATGRWDLSYFQGIEEGSFFRNLVTIFFVTVLVQTQVGEAPRGNLACKWDDFLPYLPVM